MIVVKVEIWPHGVETKSFEVARLWVANTDGTANYGDYKVALCKEAPWEIGEGGNKPAQPELIGEIKRHPRQSHVLALVRKAIKAVGL